MTELEKRVSKIAGKREIPSNTIIFDQPAELGYRCPVCKNKQYYPEDGDFDYRLEWSEYKGFIWCRKCKKDFPSCLCIDLEADLPDFVTSLSSVDYAIEVYLTCLKSGAEET